jgi:hypothetical protein
MYTGALRISIVASATLLAFIVFTPRAWAQG